MKIKFENDKVTISDLLPEAIGAAKAGDLTLLTTAINALDARIDSLELRPVLSGEYDLFIVNTPAP